MIILTTPGVIRFLPIRKSKDRTYCYEDWCIAEVPDDFNATELDLDDGFHDFDFSQYKGTQRRDKIARNLVDYKVGKVIFSHVEHLINKKIIKQVSLFE